MLKSLGKRNFFFVLFQVLLLLSALTLYHFNQNPLFTILLFVISVGSSFFFLFFYQKTKKTVEPQTLQEIQKDCIDTAIDHDLENQFHHHHKIAEMWPKISENIEKLYHKSNQVNLFTLLEFEVVEEEFKKISTLVQGARKVQNAEQLISSEIKTISENSNKIKTHTSLCIEKSNQIQGIMGDISNSNSDLSVSVESFVKHLKLIEEFLSNIVQISKKTKTLSINASIEATKAGIKGSGFAVLAKEIRSLAENTGKYTDSIHDLLGQIRLNSQKIYTSMQSNSKNIDHGNELVSASSSSMNQLNSQMVQIDSMIQNIRSLLDNQSLDIKNVLNDVNSIENLSNKTKDQTNQLKIISEQMSILGEESVNQAILFPTQGSPIAKLMKASEKLQKDVEKCIHDGIASRELTESTLFQPNFLKKIDGAVPRYHCDYLPFFDNKIQPILQDFKDKYPYGDILNITINDLAKFVPVCCKEFMKPLTGNAMIDGMGNFSRRFFDNPLVIKINKAVSERDFFLSSYAIPQYKLTLSDLSFSVNINGKLWGAIRIGFIPENMK